MDGGSPIKVTASDKRSEDIEALCAKRLFVGFDGLEANDHIRRLIQRGVGGVVLFGRNCSSPQQVSELCATLKAEAKGRELLIAVDQEGGRVARLRDGFTNLPSPRELSKADNPGEAAAAAGRVLGKELRAVNIDLNFAPVMDVDTNPDNPVIGDRAFSSQPSLAASMGAEFITAMQRERVGACAKHFPGHGDSATDSHVGLPVLPHSRERLRQVELPPFAAAAQAGVAAIMVGHLHVPSLAGAGKGPALPATMDRGVVQHLRGEMGYSGVILTDDLHMGAITEKWGIAEAVVRGAEAGVDMFLVCHTEAEQHAALDALAQAAREGRLTAESLRAASARVDRLAREYAGSAPGCGCGGAMSGGRLTIVGSKENRDLLARILGRAGLPVA